MEMKIYQNRRTKENGTVWDMHGSNYTIFKMVGSLSPDLTKLKANQSVVYGNGKDYYYLIEKKEESK